jgi:hypothetical protein
MSANGKPNHHSPLFQGVALLQAVFMRYLVGLAVSSAIYVTQSLEKSFSKKFFGS